MKHLYSTEFSKWRWLSHQTLFLLGRRRPLPWGKMRHSCFVFHQHHTNKIFQKKKKSHRIPSTGRISMLMEFHRKFLYFPHTFSTHLLRNEKFTHASKLLIVGVGREEILIFPTAIWQFRQLEKFSINKIHFLKTSAVWSLPPSRRVFETHRKTKITNLSLGKFSLSPSLRSGECYLQWVFSWRRGTKEVKWILRDEKVYIGKWVRGHNFIMFPTLFLLLVCIEELFSKEICCNFHFRGFWGRYTKQWYVRYVYIETFRELQKFSEYIILRPYQPSSWRLANLNWHLPSKYNWGEVST